MEHLSALDAGFLEAEDADRHVSLAIGGLAIVDGPIPEHDRIIDMLSERVLSEPRYRQVLRTKPFDLGAPEWVDDPSFNLAHHVRRAALPAPGNEQALVSFVGDAMRQRLDRDRPLWECWIIEGLAEGRWAVLTKVHHCIADGISATRMMAGLCDEGHVSSFADRLRNAEECTAADDPRSMKDTFRLPLSALAMPVRLARAAARSVSGAVEIAAGVMVPGDQTSLNGPITTQRRYAVARVSLSDIATVQRALGVTVNDVALAALSASYRRALLRRGEQPTPRALRTLVPVSMRRSDTGRTDNQVSIMLPFLPVDIADPVQRLFAVHDRLSRAKGGGQRQAGKAAVDAVARFVPFALSAWTIRALTRLPQHGVVALATNVPGPSRPLHLLGREVVDLLPVPPIAMQLRTGVAILSYADTLAFGITGDYDTAADVDELASGIEDAVDQLVELCSEHRLVRLVGAASG
ncbi:WS/DGAT/MGAT family O-acyltransferase [Aldersonia kunmingensis]|uniref:WS/DGAT/MGAT family O-acyltransferase n=1 Tax=Aldersonia kunmingensis TaxID=408066 RepID=UPI0008370A71|nr:wax ester/triacylglycerol synthase family O-acyltransferase [Aldersonia kunmingensis]